MKRTQKEVKEWKEKMTTLAKTIKAMTEVQRLEFAAQSPVFTCEGHVLSTWNQCALIIQGQWDGICPTLVAGFRQWKKAARQVRKGQHACGSIMVPMKGKKAETSDSGDSEKKTGLRFKWVPMFDVTQTEEIQAA